MLNVERAVIKPATGFRWTICALIFFATTVNYLDRQLFSLLVPFFENDLRLGPTDLALINVSFILPYGFAMIFVGRLIDRVGTRRGLSTTFLLWNIASIGHALVRSLFGFMGIRFLLGLGEAGMYPSAVKTITDWFPRKERALATGYFNAGANLGALLAPVLGVYVAAHYGWRTCFLFTGGVGIVWIFFWRALYRDPENNPKVSHSELEYIQSDEERRQTPISYRQLFGIRPLYGLGIAKALSDAPWWFYLTWMPKFLVDQFHLTVGQMGWAIPIIYIVADVGSVFGGWMSSQLIRKGYDVGVSRKLALLTCALLVTPVISVGFLVDHPAIGGIPCAYWAVGIVALAAGAHQGWSCNLFTMISDTVPSGSIAVAVGAINGFAMIGASAMQFFVGRSVQVTGSYILPFVAAGTLYLLALVILHLFVPKVRQEPTERLASMPLVVAGGVALLACLGGLQYVMNRPPYRSLSDYEIVRARELKTSGGAVIGPSAKVGWMQAEWVRWQIPGSTPKLELIKFDLHGCPFIESKGVKATGYKGPSLAKLASDGAW